MVLLALGFSACSLDETLNQDLNKQQAEAYLNANTDVAALIKGAYDLMKEPYQDQARLWAAQQHTTDETSAQPVEVTGMITVSGVYCTTIPGQQTTIISSKLSTNCCRFNLPQPTR